MFTLKQQCLQYYRQWEAVLLGSEAVGLFQHKEISGTSRAGLTELGLQLVWGRHCDQKREECGGEGQLPEPLRCFVAGIGLTAILQSCLNWVIQFWMCLRNNNSLVKNKSWF